MAAKRDFLALEKIFPDRHYKNELLCRHNAFKRKKAVNLAPVFCDVACNPSAFDNAC
jgi:hypothetical protein